MGKYVSRVLVITPIFAISLLSFSAKTLLKSRNLYLYGNTHKYYNYLWVTYGTSSPTWDSKNFKNSLSDSGAAYPQT